jgi:predicted nucleotidyltransferase
MSEKILPQQKILDNLINFLKSQTEVSCAWFEGSHARSEQDEFSDVDLWVDCENGSEKDLLAKIVKFVETQLNQTAQVAHNFFQDHPEIFQNYIIVKDFVLDLCIQSKSRTPKVFFAKNEEVKVIFDKNNSLQFSNELRSTVYTENLEAIKKWILAKSTVIENKAKRGDYFQVAGIYFSFLEDVIMYYLARDDVTKCTYSHSSAYKDAAKLDKETQEFLQSLFKAGTIEEINQNLKIIHSQFNLVPVSDTTLQVKIRGFPPQSV